MLFYIAFIAALNLCVGYVLGLYAGALPGLGIDRPGWLWKQSRWLVGKEESSTAVDTSDVDTRTEPELAGNRADHAAEGSEGKIQAAPHQASSGGETSEEVRSTGSLRQPLLTAAEMDAIADGPVPQPGDEESRSATASSAAESPSAAEASRHRPPSAAKADVPQELTMRDSLENWITNYCRHHDESENLPVAILEVDDAAELRTVQGEATSERVFGKIAEMVTTSLGSNRRKLALGDDGQLLVALPDESLDSATQLMEQIRQQVEHTVFVAEEIEISATISCGLSEASREVVGPLLFGRLEEALEEAKRFGKNRTFVHDGSFATPVLPPELAVTATTQVLDRR